MGIPSPNPSPLLKYYSERFQLGDQLPLSIKLPIVLILLIVSIWYKCVILLDTFSICICIYLRFPSTIITHCPQIYVSVDLSISKGRYTTCDKMLWFTYCMVQHSAMTSSLHHMKTGWLLPFETKQQFAHEL